MDDPRKPTEWVQIHNKVEDSHGQSAVMHLGLRERREKGVSGLQKFVGVDKFGESCVKSHDLLLGYKLQVP